MAKAIFASSADPIHYGHIDVIQRAAGVFDEVVAGIGVNADKNYMFPLDERIEMARRSLDHVPNAKVEPFHGLLVDYAYENGISVVVKAARNSADFDYEKVLHRVGQSQQPDIDTHLLFADPKLEHISSTTTKAIQKEHGLIHEYVPLYVKQCLEARMSGQYIVGVTGEIGSGKSYVSKKFEELGKQNGIPVHNIELDYIGHQIIGGLKQPAYQEVRETIAKTFGQELKQPDGRIDQKALAEIVFNDKHQLEKLNEIMHNPILTRYRKELYGKKGLVLVNAALIAEWDVSYLCNNNVVLVNVDKPVQEKRLKKRHLEKDDIETRLATQYSFEEKKQKIEQGIEEDNNGKTWILDNSDDSKSDEEITRVFQEVVDELGAK